MNRICIYMTHNTTNKLKAHVRLFLESIVKYADVYLVCNFVESLPDNEIPNGIKDVFYRENKGWDAGAYKDSICEYIGWEEIFKYDELILANDSFYGPLYDWKDTLDYFEKDDCDYWGITGQIAGNYDNPYYEFPKHIHSYFLAFKSKIIMSEEFMNYWEKLRYPKTFRNALVDFEIAINVAMSAAGFRGQCYTDLYNIRMRKNEIPYYLCSYELIKEYKLPILKKKSLLVRNKGFVNILKAINYINENNLYPTELIWDDLNNQFNNIKLGKHLLDFIKEYKYIYIYGNGVCGKNLRVYLKLNNIDIEGVATSDGDASIGVFTPEQMKNENTGVIISVIDPKASQEIKTLLSERFSEEQLFLLYDCTAIRIPV